MNGASRVSGDMIITNEGKSICVAQWFGTGDDDEDVGVSSRAGRSTVSVVLA